MKTAVTALLAILIFCIESTILKSVSIRGITPNLIVIFVVSYGILRGRLAGGIVGLFLGILMDLFFFQVVGFQTLLFFYIGIVAGYFNKDFYKENYVLPIVLISCVDFLYGLIMYIFTYLIRGRLDIGYYVVNTMIPEVIYTLLVGIFIYRLLYYLEEKMTVAIRNRYNRY